MEPGINYLRSSSRSSRKLKYSHESMRFTPTHETTDVTSYDLFLPTRKIMILGSVLFSGFLVFGLLYVESPVLRLQSDSLELGDLETGSMT